MQKTRLILGLTAVVLSVAGGFSTTFAKVFSSKTEAAMATWYTATVINGIKTCTATNVNCVQGTGQACLDTRQFTSAPTACASVTLVRI